MKQVDRLIMREIFGPWLFGVGFFTALLFAATFLGRIAGYVVDGLPVTLVLKIVGLLIPPLLVKTFSMAILLAGLLSFGRLSSDSEIVSLRAAGASVYRIVLPVAIFSILIAGITFFFNDYIVPPAAKAGLAIAIDIAKTSKVKSSQPISKTIVEKGKLRLAVVAKNVNLGANTLQGVTVIFYDDNEHEQYVGFAKELEYHAEDDWRIRGGMRVISTDLKEDATFNEVWPHRLPTIRGSIADLASDRGDDFDRYTMSELKDRIDKNRRDQTMTAGQLANNEYGYWNKLSVPLAALIFGTLGAVLGIRSHRTGTASGFALAIGIIFSYVTVANFMNVWAQGGVLPPWAASFAPIVIGMVAAVILIRQKNS